MPASSLRSRAASAFRSFTERHGRRTLAILGVILLTGGALRFERVINPNADPGDDAYAYMDLARSLYEDQSYGSEEFDDPTDWSPGAPLIYAASYYVTFGARDGVARLDQALLGLAGIFLVYLLGRRLAGPTAGLLAAGATAVYPPFISSTGAVLSEPPAFFFLPAAILAFLWARDRTAPVSGAEGSTRRAWAPWLLPGALLGAMCLIRPEYMLVAFVLILVALGTIWRESGLRSALAPTAALALACALVIVPWTVRNYIALDRVVPISTGSGKALYVGTSLPNDGEYHRVKASLVERFQGRTLDPDSEALDDVDPTPLFDRVAEEHPELSRDAALSKIGKDQFFDYVSDDPVGYAGMTVRKVWRMWSAGVGEAMSSTAGRVIQVILVVLGLAGLILLAVRRRYEALVLAVPIVVITGIAALTLAPPRRNEILMTLILPLAAAAIVAGMGRIRDLSSSGP